MYGRAVQCTWRNTYPMKKFPAPGTAAPSSEKIDAYCTLHGTVDSRVSTKFAQQLTRDENKMFVHQLKREIQSLYNRLYGSVYSRGNPKLIQQALGKSLAHRVVDYRR